MISPDMVIMLPAFSIVFLDDKASLLISFRVNDAGMMKFIPDSMRYSMLEEENIPLSMMNVTSVRPADLRTSTVFLTVVISLTDPG